MQLTDKFTSIFPMMSTLSSILLKIGEFFNKCYALKPYPSHQILDATQKKHSKAMSKETIMSDKKNDIIDISCSPLSKGIMRNFLA